MKSYISIEGVIGAGKTSLARYLQDVFEATLLLEIFEANPFLARFYENRERFAFQTQVFFLLSRYDQQRQISSMRRPLISDYIFAKDKLFAQQNLSGDELATYERVYEALATNIQLPDLIIFLRASTDKLMEQIARRDRPYERNMDRNYIDQLRIAYDKFFSTYDTVPVLTIDINRLDFVQHEDDRAYVVDKVRGALGIGPQQTTLPGVTPEITPSIETSIDTLDSTINIDLETTARRLEDFQHFHQQFDKEKGFDQDLFLNFAMLQEEIGELATALVHWQRLGTRNVNDVGDEFADVLAYIFKLANYTGVDLESVYLKKMKYNQQRSWKVSR